MIPTEAIRTQVATCEQFKTVKGIAGLTAAIERGQFANDTAFVGWISKRPIGKNNLVNAVDQEIQVTISVLYWVRDASDGTGQAASDENEAIVDQIQGALLNWSPNPDLYTPFLYGGGRLVQFMPPAALYAEEYTTTLRARKTS